MDLQCSTVNTRALLDESVQMMSDAAVSGRVSISVEIENPPETILADQRKLNQVMYNLLSNAVKFSHGGTVTVRADGSADGTLLVVSVIDSGIGIQPDDLDRIFQPFERVRTQAGRETRGTGLGLSVAREFVALHGGRLWAESEGLGRGSTLLMEIPVQPGP
ncbi:MAG: ATP-binding protein [Spirochaetia bacterium]